MAFTDLLIKYDLSPELFDVTAPPPLEKPKQQATPPWGTGIPTLCQADSSNEYLDELPSDLDDLEPPF